jgi:hypothetical protein
MKEISVGQGNQGRLERWVQQNQSKRKGGVSKEKLSVNFIVKVDLEK